MLISQIVQLDAQSNEFARRNAATQIGDSPEGETFADYLAATMNPQQSRPASGEINHASSSGTQRESAPGERTPEDAYRRDSSEREVSNDDATRDRSTGAAKKGADAGTQADGSARRAADDANDKAAKSDSPQKKNSSESGRDAGEAKAVDGEGPKKPRFVPKHSLGDELKAPVAHRNPAPSDEDTKAADSITKAGTGDSHGRVKARRLSDGNVAIDVDLDVDPASTAKKDRESGEAGDGRDTDTSDRVSQPKRESSGPELPEAGKSRKISRETVEDAAKATPSSRTSLEKSQNAADSDDRSTRDEPKLEVRDLRAARDGGRGKGESSDSENGRRESGHAALASEQKGDSELRESPTATGRTGSFEGMRAESGQTSAATRGGESLTRTATGAAASLRHTLQEQLNGEIVRSARLVVRGNGRGEIRLNLRPDTLGNVRITLQMQDGHIAGRIIVDNQTVREVFEQNLASLQKAFEENGLEAGGVEISLADSGNEPDQSSEKKTQRANVREVAERFGYSVPDLSTIDETHDLVDVVV